MSETRNWNCPNCDGRKIYGHQEMMAHIREIHGLDPATQKGERKLIMHMKLACGGSVYKWEWTLAGLKFEQVITVQGSKFKVQGSTVSPSALPPPGSLTDDDVIWFGKFKGRKLAEVPASYLDWLNGQDWMLGKPYAALLKYIDWRRPALNQELQRKERAR